jgi:hypothetical protein
MRAAWLITSAAAVACGRQAGTLLEISVPANAKSVELFLGDAPAGSGAIGPPTTDPDVPRGRYFLGEGWTSVEPSSSFGTLKGSSLTYRLERDHGGSNMLQRLLIVAYDGQGSPVGVKILDDVPLATTDTLPVTLDPAVAIQGIANSAGSAERVQVWRRPDDGASQLSACAVVWHPNDAAGSAVEFFVPGDDPDCDGAVPECNTASAFNYCEIDDTKVGLSGATCLLETADNNACRLGAPPSCVDSGPDCVKPACTPSPVLGCMPTQVCAGVKAHNCSTLDPLCLGMAVAISTGPTVVCDVTLDSGGLYCSDALDPTTFGVLGTRQCQNVYLQTYGPTPAFGTSVVADGATLSLSTGNGMGACSRMLSITGTLLVPPLPTPIFVVFETTPAPDQYIFVPLHLNNMGTTGCPQPAADCRIDSPSTIPCP